MIEAQRLSFRAGRRSILEGVSFHAAAGETVCIIGPNGAGKSTLLKCLAGINETSAGALTICGRPLASYSRRSLARILSYVPQAYGHELPFFVHDFVMMGRYAHIGPLSLPGKADRDAVEHAMATTGTIALADRHMATLSGGELQRVFIAAALAQQTCVMLLDEPTTFLDPKHRFEIHGLLMKISRDHGVTTVIATHDLAFALQSADRIIALKEGKLVYCGEAADMTVEATLSSMYEIPFLVLRHPATGRPIVIAEDA
ncbi:MAG TPA: ABC transporter ATP-binding protein [Deltaproteobacteria bacterium]|nr:ABC transporter ATP-binding protein [Deltaproteobacteria bacterium]